MSKITKSARGEPCLVRIPGVCISGGDNETTVFAHLNGGGMGMKHPDSEGAYCCSACHDVYDRRLAPRPITMPWWEIDLAFFEGCVRTRKKLIDKGLLILK